MGREVRYARNGDIHIAYQIRGDGPMDLVLVPTWFSNLDLVDMHPPIARGVERIGSFARLILYDRRGSGLSDRTCGHATLEEGIDDLFAVLDDAGSTSTALLGLNESGSLCALAAASRPERVSGLVLYGTYATTVRQEDYPWAPAPEERQQEVEFLIETWGREEVAAGVSPGAAQDPRFAEWAALWMRGSVTRDALPRAYEILSKTDVRHVLPSIQVPTLILHRTDDELVPIDNARYLAEHIPGAKFVELPGVDHLPFLGDTDSIADEIEEFLTGARRERQPERILATILFIDIVGSSVRATELGDSRWGELLDRYE